MNGNLQIYNEQITLIHSISIKYLYVNEFLISPQEGGFLNFTSSYIEIYKSKKKKEEEDPQLTITYITMYKSHALTEIMNLCTYN